MKNNIEKTILNKIMPFFIRDLKESNLYPRGLYKDVSISLPNIGNIKNDIQNINSLKDIFAFEYAFFKSDYANDLKPLDKPKCSCKKESDVIRFILYFMLNDIIDASYFTYKGYNKEKFVKIFINKICKENNLY